MNRLSRLTERLPKPTPSPSEKQTHTVFRALGSDTQQFYVNPGLWGSGIDLRLRTLACLLLLTSCRYAAATAQESWEQTSGPGSGQVVTMAVDQQGTLFAATSAALFRSSDRGIHWMRFGALPANATVYTLCAAGESTLLLGTGQGILRSTDLGTTWVAVSPDVIQNSVRAIKVVKRDTMIAGSLDGVFRSTDLGTTWTPIPGTGISIYNVQCLARGPQGELYIGTGFGMSGWPGPRIPNGRVLKSTDSGNTWVGAGAGPTSLDLDRNVLSIAVDGLGHVYTVDEPFGRIEKSTDGGSTWRTLRSYGPNLAIIVANDAGQLFLGLQSKGLLRSTDGGDSWDTTNTGLTDSHINVLLAEDGQGVFAGTRKGVARWDEGAKQWSLIGVPVSDVTALAIIKTGEVFAVTSLDGLFFSSDNGSHWIPRNSGTETASLRWLTSTPDGDMYIQNNTSEFLRSTDAGLTWTTVTTPFPANELTQIAITSNGEVFAGTYTSGVYRSTNNGKQWQSTGMLNTAVYKLSCTHSNALLIYSTLGFCRSTDYGKSWSVLAQPWDLPPVRALAGNSQGHVFVATSNGLYRTMNNGQTWENLVPAWNDIISLIVTHNEELLVGSASGGVHQSSNSGESWTPILQGLPSVRVSCLAQSPTSQLFLGTSGAGVFRRSTLKTHTSPRQEESNEAMFVFPPYPNPFNGYVTIGYAVSRKARVAATIFNSLGEVVVELVNREIEAGAHTVHFDGSRLASGVYFCRIQAGAFVDMKKLVLLR